MELVTKSLLRTCPVCGHETSQNNKIFCGECQQLLPDSPPLDNRYKIERSLGEGGFAHTYLANDIRTRKPVAIKRVELAPGSPEQANTIRRFFERELKLLAGLNTPGHANIPEVLDTFSDEKAEYLVMKYVTGETLKQKLYANGPMAWDDLSQRLEQMLSALHYMHSRPEPVVHGDVKLDNIIEDDTGRLFLVDFGLARQQSIPGSWSTESGAAAGTPGFASWDHWRGGPSPMSDVYAVGMTAYLMLAGLGIYPDLVRREQMTGQRFTPHAGLTPPDFEELDIPKDVQDLLLAATTTEPAQRPTAIQFQNRHVAIREAKNRPGNVSAPVTVTRPLVFPGGDAAHSEAEFAMLADHHLDEALDFLYHDDALARWLEAQCFRGDLAQAVRDIRDKRLDEHEALELCLQTLDPGRPAPALVIEPDPLTVARSFFTRTGRGEFTLVNKGPGYARVELRSSDDRVKLSPDVLTLDLNDKQTVKIVAPPRSVRKSKNRPPLKLDVKTERAYGPHVESYAVKVARQPGWYFIREAVMLAVMVTAGLWLLTVGATWWPCVATQGLSGCQLPTVEQSLSLLQTWWGQLAVMLAIP
ncbi:MAG: serine/threonine protein kinase [Chloroflexi bacterium]|nr:serine/threonine protein kinase [Chloroflexota bacterium]